MCVFRIGVFRWRVRGKWRGVLFCEFFHKSRPMRRELGLVMCRLFIGQKFRKKFTPTPALYPPSKNTDSERGLGATAFKRVVGRLLQEFQVRIGRNFYRIRIWQTNAQSKWKIFLVEWFIFRLWNEICCFKQEVSRKGWP